MALTSDFINAVKSRDVLLIRIMLKDSLLVDKSFKLFREMSFYSECEGVHFWMEESDELEILPETEWNINLMNLELTMLVNDFTRKRLNYCQKIIRKVYSIEASHSNNQCKQNNSFPTPSGNREKDLSPKHNNQSTTRTSGGNAKNYNVIIKETQNITQLINNGKTNAGYEWKFDNIRSIQEAAKNIYDACESIIGGGSRPWH